MYGENNVSNHVVLILLRKQKDIVVINELEGRSGAWLCIQKDKI